MATHGHAPRVRRAKNNNEAVNGSITVNMSPLANKVMDTVVTAVTTLVINELLG